MTLLTRDLTDNNNAWYRQVAAGWARRIITGDSPGAWAHNTETEIQFAINQLQLRRGDHILDLGCGWGRHSVPLARYGLQVTGVDLSHDLITLARFNAQRAGVDVEWIEGDIANAPLTGEFDDIVQFCGNFLTWFADYDQALDVLARVAEMLKPGGRLLFGTPEWQPDLPPRVQDYDEWQGGAAIYRDRYDRMSRIANRQIVIFGPSHERHEYSRQTWWPTLLDMEIMFVQAGLEVCGRYNSCAGLPYDSTVSGLVYLLRRPGEGERD